MKKGKDKNGRRKKKKGNSKVLQKPNVEQWFITTITSVTEYIHIHIHT